jgi:hypothetical protein
MAAGGWAAAGYPRHNLDRRIADGTQLHPEGQPRSADRAPDQAGQIDLVLVGPAHEEIREGIIDRCRLVDLQDDLSVAGDGLETQTRVDDHERLVEARC